MENYQLANTWNNCCKSHQWMLILVGRSMMGNKIFSQEVSSCKIAIKYKGENEYICLETVSRQAPKDTSRPEIW